MHDVGTTEDRSTAVLGGVGAYAPDPKIGVAHLEELPRGLRGTPRANALAEVDIRFDRNSLIVADLSNDQSYAEQLSETFGSRAIGVSIGPSGDGMAFQRVAVPSGQMLKYSVGRTFLFDRLRSTLENGGLKLPPGDPVAKQAFAQLTELEEIMTDSGARIYAAQRSGTTIWRSAWRCSCGRQDTRMSGNGCGWRGLIRHGSYLRTRGFTSAAWT